MHEEAPSSDGETYEPGAAGFDGRNADESDKSYPSGGSPDFGA
jgi:hypothetical protein